MKKKCSECEHRLFKGGDICDGCKFDPDTGWGGFTDHSIGKHFNSDEERDKWYEEHKEEDEDED